MAVTVQTVLDDRIAKYIDRLKEHGHATEMTIVRQLVEGGYEQVVCQLHARYQRGEISFRTMAAELGLSVRELYDLLEQKGLSA
jgi:AraC-like DNA-binding protein